MACFHGCRVRASENQALGGVKGTLPGMKATIRKAASGCSAFCRPVLPSRNSMPAAQRWESWRLEIPDIQMPTQGCRSPFMLIILHLTNTQRA